MSSSGGEVGGAVNVHNKRPVIIIYPTVPPETVVIPIVSCILGFPLLALLVICCLRRRAQLARERDRRRPVNMDYSHTDGLSMIRLSPPSVHRSGGMRRAVSLRSDRSGGNGRASVISGTYPSMEMLDTVVEERSEDCELSTLEVLSTPDS